MHRSVHTDRPGSLDQVVENLSNSQDQRDVSLAFENVQLPAGDVLTEPYRVLGPDIAIISAVPDGDRDADLIKVETPGLDLGKSVIAPADNTLMHRVAHTGHRVRPKFPGKSRAEHAA